MQRVLGPEESRDGGLAEGERPLGHLALKRQVQPAQELGGADAGPSPSQGHAPRRAGGQRHELGHVVHAQRHGMELQAITAGDAAPAQDPQQGENADLRSRRGQRPEVDDARPAEAEAGHDPSRLRLLVQHQRPLRVQASGG